MRGWGISAARGTRRRRPAKLHGDRGYDYDHLGKWLRSRNITHATGGCMEALTRAGRFAPGTAEAGERGHHPGPLVTDAVQEPLSAESPLRDMPGVIVSPHTAGETVSVNTVLFLIRTD
ncbi:hypothetical protein GCM10010304_37580 [Streptomyces roseoviolaceus]